MPQNVSGTRTLNCRTGGGSSIPSEVSTAIVVGPSNGNRPVQRR